MFEFKFYVNELVFGGRTKKKEKQENFAEIILEEKNQNFLPIIDDDPGPPSIQWKKQN